MPKYPSLTFEAELTPDGVTVFERIHRKMLADIERHGAVEFTSGDGEYVAYLGTDPDGSWWAWVKKWGHAYGKAVRGPSKEAVERETLRQFGCRCAKCARHAEHDLRRALAAMLPEAVRAKEG